MENLKEKYLELMGQKYDILVYMLDITKKEVFTGDADKAENEANAFVALYQKRTNVMSRLEKIEDAMSLLDPLDEEDAEDEDFQRQVNDFKSKMKALAKEMLDLDKSNVGAYEKLSAHLKGSMKQVSQTRDLNSRYIDDYHLDNGRILDQRN